MSIGSGDYPDSSTSSTLYFSGPQTYTYITPWFNTQERKQEEKLRALFKVYVIDPTGKGSVLYESAIIIAVDAKEAERKDMVNIGQAIFESGKDSETLDIITVAVSGNCIRAKKET